LAVLIIVSGYITYNRLSKKRQYEQTAQHALVTAQVWIASARLRGEPERFAAYRDSLLKAYGLTKDDLQQYLGIYRDRPEQYEVFAELVKRYVDSLSVSETETQNIGDTTAAVTEDTVN
jgi:hypothetical protein